ncbi:MAG: sporulation protein YtfJ [Clostridiales bacterium]|nr:sporulation protein YtfJ [Clostridiales bacterium]
MEKGQNKIKEIVDGLTFHLKNLTDTNSILGQPYVTNDGCTILPVSQISFGFAAGGGEYGGKKGFISSGVLNQFAGASGAGASIMPVAFLVVTKDRVQLINTQGNNTEVDKFADLAKDIFLSLNR